MAPACASSTRPSLQLLDCFPDLRLTANISHYPVDREFAWPIDEVDHAMMHRVLDNAWGIHGRIASREQAQISLGFPQHQGWVELFTCWWEYAIHSWRRARRPGRRADLLRMPRSAPARIRSAFTPTLRASSGLRGFSRPGAHWRTLVPTHKVRGPKASAA